MLTKLRMIHAFSKACDTYDRHACLQRTVADRLIDMLLTVPLSGNHFADMGCGTGATTTSLAKHFPNSVIYGVDLAEKSLRSASPRLADTNYQCLVSDFETPVFLAETLDCIFSNMALHWSSTLPRTLTVLLQQLKRGGVLAFSLPVKGTFQEIQHPGIFFYSCDFLENWFKSYPLSVWTVQEQYVEHFYSSISALQSLKLIGANMSRIRTRAGLWTKQSIDALFPKHPITLTYKIGYFIVIKHYGN